MTDRDSWRGRLGRLVALLGSVGAVTAVVVVTQRLSDDALALLVGLSCGVAAMAPAIGLGVWLWRRQELERQREVPRSSAPAATPPVIVVAPGALPGYGNPWGALPSPPASWEVAPAERKFTIVGEE